MNTLWTPTDWNYEAELLKVYLEQGTQGGPFLVDTQRLSENDPYRTSPEDLLRVFRERGFMIVTTEDSYVPVVKKLSFDEWKVYFRPSLLFKQLHKRFEDIYPYPDDKIYI